MTQPSIPRARLAQVTPDQTDYVRGLQRQLRLTDQLLDTWCEREFGVPFAEIVRYECSQLIDALKEWKAIPADLRREAGQLDLMGIDS